MRRQTARTAHAPGKLLKIFRQPYVVAGIIVVGVAAILFAGIRWGSARAASGAASDAKSAILSNWESKNYEAVREAAVAAVATSPADPFYLAFEGFSSYYLSFGTQEGEERQSLLDEAVFSLRKALALDPKLPVLSQAEYVLGKAYFQKGSPWFDLAADNLLASKEHGTTAADTDQLLGLVYAGLGLHQKAVSQFEAAIAKDPSPVLKLSAAVSYKEMGENERMEALLGDVIAEAQDALVLQRARLMLAEAALGRQDSAGAKALLETVVASDPGSARGWYLLGLAQDALKDPIAARASWRRATSIDPNFVEARAKLAERL